MSISMFTWSLGPLHQSSVRAAGAQGGSALSLLRWLSEMVGPSSPGAPNSPKAGPKYMCIMYIYRERERCIYIYVYTFAYKYVCIHGLFFIFVFVYVL